jgi:hypothetical protein
VIVDRSERNGLISALGPRQLGSRGGRRKPLTERLKHQPNTGPPEREDRKK